MAFPGKDADSHGSRYIGTAAPARLNPESDASTTMKCPSCAQVLPAAEPQCPHCRLTLRALDLRFGAVPRHASHLTDRSQAMNLADIASLRRDLELFEERFPQVVFSVFVADPPPGGSVTEYAFWLVNRVRFSSLTSIGPENFDMLLVLAPGKREAALVIGYGLEDYLKEEDLRAILAGAREDVTAARWPEAIRGCLAATTERLRQIALELEEQRRSQTGVTNS